MCHFGGVSELRRIRKSTFHVLGPDFEVLNRSFGVTFWNCGRSLVALGALLEDLVTFFVAFGSKME